MVNANPSPDERVIYLALKNVFKGQNAEVRNPKPIRKLIQKHQNQLDVQPLIREHNLDTLCNLTQNLLAQGIFSSALKAKLRFPELFNPSPTHSAEKEASEAEAAKIEADAIEQFVQSSSSVVEPPAHGKDEQIAQEPGSPMLSASRNNTLGQLDSTQSLAIPPLFPVYLPFKVQHQLLRHLQSLLESACYDFGLRTMPEILHEHKWDCAEAMELNRWVGAVMKQENIMANKRCATPAETVLRAVANIRHTAVHRLRVNAKAIQQFLLDAETLAIFIEDVELQRRISRLRGDTRAIVEELEQNKHFLRSKLDETLRKIADQRRELQALEEDAIAEMAKEDQEYGALAGQMLTQAIAPSDDSSSTAMDTEKTVIYSGGDGSEGLTVSDDNT
ncbi:hypothetical protein NLU13_6228 [Sarocladium strictum]|uniref:Ubiquinol-cytochrome-c reductase cytochrome c1 n=1 Tax=Sarocladium strictum TaxID=5046 RepID=A0AA39GFU7_SARSR|nr:hypothetical protein NLU13_6228 [Sarocladium strictum]